MALDVVVAGATGAVGREMLNTLHERRFPVGRLTALASRRSIGQTVWFGDQALKVQGLDSFDFGSTDIVLMSAGGQTSLTWAPRMAAAGALVIDNSSRWRMDPDVPLVVPEVNPGTLRERAKKGIIANPNCSTIQLVVALKPLHDAATIRRVVVSTYQSASGAGQKAIDELMAQTKGFFLNESPPAVHLPRRIAFNIVPQVDVLMEDGASREEWKMAGETRKILDPGIRVTTTCVRVPVVTGHSEAVNVELGHPMTAREARDCLAGAPGVVVTDADSPEAYATALDCVGEPRVLVSRIREDTTIDNGLWLWIVADNLRKGAALNAVQIAEICAGNGTASRRG